MLGVDGQFMGNFNDFQCRLIMGEASSATIDVHVKMENQFRRLLNHLSTDVSCCQHIWRPASRSSTINTCESKWWRAALRCWRGSTGTRRGVIKGKALKNHLSEDGTVFGSSSIKVCFAAGNINILISASITHIFAVWLNILHCW